MANRWGKVEAVIDFVFLGSKITANGDYSLEIKRRLLLGREAMINIDRILKSRDITLPTEIHLVKAMVFPVIMYACESLTMKKAEHYRIDAFELWNWRRLMRVPWTARRSNQSFLKEISPEYSLEGLMLKLKLQYFGHLMLRTDSLEKTLMLGKIEGRRRRGWQGIRYLDSITDSMDMSLSKFQKLVMDREAVWHAAVHGVKKSRTQLSDWTELHMQCVSHSVMSNSVTSWTVAYQAPLSMEFSRQEYCSGEQGIFPTLGLNPGLEPRSPALQADSLPSKSPGKLHTHI